MQVYKMILATFLCCISCAYGLVKISGLQDYNFATPTFPVTSSEEITHTFCMYRQGNNRVSKTVYLTATGSNSSPGFFLSNGKDTIPYEVWVANTGQSCPTPPSSGTNCIQLSAGLRRQVLAYRNRRESNQDCRRNTTLARLTILIPASGLINIPSAGDYSDTLTLFLQPS